MLLISYSAEFVGFPLSSAPFFNAGIIIVNYEAAHSQL